MLSYWRHIYAPIAAEDWLAGELDNGDQGIFPSNFVEIIEALGATSSSRSPEPEPEPTPAPAPVQRQVSAKADPTKGVCVGGMCTYMPWWGICMGLITTQSTLYGHVSVLLCGLSVRAGCTGWARVQTSLVRYGDVYCASVWAVQCYCTGV